MKHTQTDNRILALLLAVSLLLGGCAGGETGGDAAPVSASLCLSELMPANDSCPSPDGLTLGFLELKALEAVSLGGWKLRMGGKSYVLPAQLHLEEGELLCLWCGEGEGSALYTGFKLKSGASLTLYDAEGAAQLSLSVPAVEAGCSLIYDSGEGESSEAPTPGFENSAAGRRAYLLSLGESETAVVLSELMAVNHSCLPDADGDFSDWIELCNTGTEPAELGGCWLSDDPEQWRKWQLPELSLAPGERLVIFCSGKDRTEGELHTSFSLSREGETLTLRSATGLELWAVSYEAAEADLALCFEGEERSLTRAATPGYPNDDEGREAFLAASDRHGALVVSEAVLYNDDYFHHSGDTFDWVELLNAGDAPLQLSDYYLSDDDADRLCFRLPERVLQPGERMVVFCGEPPVPSSYPHAPFALSSLGDCLYVTRADGSLSDYVGLYDLPLDGSMGRMEGQPGFFYFEKRSPDEENGQGWRKVAAPPTASVAPGLYEDVESLTVELEGEGEIYYTLDGSKPLKKGEKYTGPITLDSSAVIRAVSVVEGKVTSGIASYSYLLNEGVTLPVVSLACDPGEFNLVYRYNAAGYLTNVSYFGPDGSFSADASFKLHGASSRTVWNKKSFKLSFLHRYGGDLSFDLFHNGCESYHSILLRGGDTEELHTYRDSLASLIANRTAVQDPLTLDSRYCVLFVNGAYWGIYALREAYSAEYMAAHTGSDPDKVEIVRAPVTEQSWELYQLYSFIIGKKMSDPENYAYVAERMDMKSLAQWLCFESYFGNLDPTGNIRYVKADRPDAKWRLMFFDLDIAMASKIATIENILDTSAQIGTMLNSLQRSEDFRLLVLETASQLWKNGLKHETVLSLFEEMAAELEEEMPRNLKRWSERIDYEYHLDRQRGYLGQERDDTWLALIQRFTKASDEQMKEYFP